MKNIQATVLLTSLLIFLTVGDTKAEPPIVLRTATPGQVRVSPLGRLANVALVVRIGSNESNRRLSVGCDGLDGGMFASSEVSLAGKGIEGRNEKEIFNFGFDLSPATYRCEAVLIRTVDGKTKKFTSFIEVSVH